MPLRRFFVPPAQIRDGVATLPSGQAHHLRHVLRLEAGTQVEVFDGEGRAWAGAVRFTGGGVRVLLQRALEAHEEPGLRITLALAIIRQDRFEWAIEKATELGVAHIVPVEARFSEIRVPPEKLPARIERWSRIAGEAARQSERTTVPRILPPVTAAGLFQLPEISQSSKLWFHERSGDRPNRTSAEGGRLALVVGPEGGWHESETEAARNAGCRIVTLGPRILRSETAALAALAVFQCGWGQSTPPGE